MGVGGDSFVRRSLTYGRVYVGHGLICFILFPNSRQSLSQSLPIIPTALFGMTLRGNCANYLNCLD